MDGAQFAKMLSDKHLFELNRMEYKYSTVSVKEFAELLRQNFAQPLPLTDFSGNKPVSYTHLDVYKRQARCKHDEDRCQTDGQRLRSSG